MSTQFVQFGRLCVIEAGENIHKVALITDILDYKTVQVEAPDVKRQVMPLKSVVLTDILCPSETPLTSKKVAELFQNEKLHDKFFATEKGKKETMAIKYAALPESEKVKLNIARKTRDRIIRKTCFK